MTFFTSRWVPLPDWVAEAPGPLPAGFRAAGVAAGIKPSGGPDVGLLVCGAPDTVSAARFTRSGALAAPVLLTQERTRLDALRVVAVNSGNANAATGGRGLDAAAKVQGAAAMVGGVAVDQSRSPPRASSVCSSTPTPSCAGSPARVASCAPTATATSRRRS